jgi:hypothetical protein
MKNIISRLEKAGISVKNGKIAKADSEKAIAILKSTAADNLAYNKVRILKTKSGWIVGSFRDSSETSVLIKNPNKKQEWENISWPPTKSDLDLIKQFNLSFKTEKEAQQELESRKK